MANRVGETLGKYRLIELLGKGGMAEVYKAYHEKLDRYVTIKILHNYLADGEDFLARFDREAKAIALLRHPHIVQIHDFEVEDDTYYMVMEYIDNGTLTSQIAAYNADNSYMPLEEVRHILQQISSAMDYAHQKGFIHRDIKPSNILLDSKGDAYLTDFGIAHIISDTQFTATGSLIGTPAYMSPEQGLGDPLGAVSDIYSLGIVFYELLTGKTPFVSDTPIAIIHKHINEAPPKLRAVRKDLPAALEDVLQKALEKEPRKRYGSATEFFQAFTQVLRNVSNEEKERIEAAPSIGFASAIEETDVEDSEAPTEVMSPDTIAEITGKPSQANLEKKESPATREPEREPQKLPGKQVKQTAETGRPAGNIPFSYSKPGNQKKILFSVLGILLAAAIIIVIVVLSTPKTCNNTGECMDLTFYYWEKGERELALDALKKAIDLIPPEEHRAFAWVWCDRAALMEAVGNPDEAEISRQNCEEWGFTE